MFTKRHSVTGSARIGPFRATAAVLAALLVVQVPACDDDTGPDARVYVTDVQLLGQPGSAVLQGDFLPEGSADGPSVRVEDSATVINGGSLQMLVESDTAFEQVRIGVQAVSDPDGGTEVGTPGPVRGYYEIGTGGPVTETVLVLTIAQALPATSFIFDVAAVAEGGAQGATAQQAASVVAVASGEVQVSVSWDAPSDVDLYVVDPSGDEIYYGASSAPSGGFLDLDSNAGCNLDNTNNENIVFEEAPAGTYTVRVNYWSSCEVEQTNYIVTIQLPGQEPQVHHGTFTGQGEGGGAGAGDVVTTFTVG